MIQLPIGKRDAPFSLRLSFEERTRLAKAAGDLPIAAYIKSLLFADDAPVVRTRGRLRNLQRQSRGESPGVPSFAPHLWTALRGEVHAP